MFSQRFVGFYFYFFVKDYVSFTGMGFTLTHIFDKVDMLRRLICNLKCFVRNSYFIGGILSLLRSNFAFSLDV